MATQGQENLGILETGNAPGYDGWGVLSVMKEAVLLTQRGIGYLLDRIRRGLTAICAAWMLLTGVDGAETTLTILHTGDLQGAFGRILQAGALKAQVRGEVGGVLLLDVGNAVSGSEAVFEHPKRRSSPTVDLLNRAGYDAWTPGHRELNLSRNDLTRFLRGAEFPVLGANLHQPETGRPLFQVQPYAVVRSGGLRVGLLGLAEGGGHALAGDPVLAARYYVPLLRERADVVVLLTHQDTRADSTLAASVPGIDAIVGAPAPGVSAGLQEVNGVAIQRVERGGQFLGRIDLTLAKGHVQTHAGQLILLESGAEHAEMFAEALTPWTVRLGAETLSVTDPLGTCAGGFGAAGQPAAMGYLVADLVREATGADLALVAATGIDGELPPGPIRVLDLFRMYSLSHRVVEVSMTGEEIRALLEAGLDDLQSFFYPSGVAVVYDLSRPGGARILSVNVGEKRPMNLRKTFRVAVEEGIEHFQLLKRGAVGEPVRDLLARHIKEAGVIRGSVDDRIREK